MGVIEQTINSNSQCFYMTNMIRRKCFKKEKRKELDKYINRDNRK